MTADRSGPRPDVAIIGGGIVGVAAAAFLAEAGATVRLYERSSIAAGASGRNSGVVQHPFDPILAGLYRGSLDEYRTLAGLDAGFEIDDEPAGLMLVGHDGDLVRTVAADWAAAWPESRPEVLIGGELLVIEPALALDLAACRLAIGYPVAPAAATQAFATLARRRGVEVIIGEARLVVTDGRVVGVTVGDDRRTQTAASVLVAAGPWTPEIVDRSRSWQPIRAIWGVVAAIELVDAPGHVLEAAEIEIEPGSGDGTAAGEPAEPAAPSEAGVDFSLVTARGSSSLGSTFLPFEPEPAAWLPAIRRVGARYVPGVADAPLLALRHCARPFSTDGRPLVGAVSGIEGLWVAAGHGPWGISTGPGSARLVVDLILGRIDGSAIPTALDPNRFGPVQRQDSGSNR